ncbi:MULTISPECIES: LytR/AlgR family response regulator transcription factor [Tenacibaculum]|uniref:DNA-binding response regulator n=1 Tax=Tenacibaculum discolor TaxID=361581 RepID=A0A2G1BTH4_9FLAO|nr:MULTISPECIES: LytTR family DNA-binding domain-containing protein [Tenacibaculum]PHO00589.1 DNA-binding response regulator [Rhodobacteraceae bacterium 4F10]MDP2542611.1 LytTR family DNA-binding domain-containing protein [Tenacibaculum discolor]NVK07984.1 response regulator transcription factor [Tenacibaculum sp.]PHN97254.1 DNA-binding response regulator [Tenacibaculum discolor]RLJ98615.1 LytTR family two component transcriptional regulator [Tenacibaculum discolor]
MANKITCVIVDDEPIAREILESFIDKTPNLELISSCKNAMEALQVAQTENIDLFFLDINMPEITGLSLAKIINNKSQIIFTTAYRDYAVDGFNLSVIDYLLKPIAFDRFLQAIQKVTEPTNSNMKVSTENDNKKDFMFVRADRKMVKINFKDILYIESLGDYVKVFTNNDTVITRETISNFEATLPSDCFIRVHRSYIVSISKISSYTNEYIEIAKKAVPISRSYKESVLQKLAQV